VFNYIFTFPFRFHSSKLSPNLLIVLGHSVCIVNRINFFFFFHRDECKPWSGCQVSDGAFIFPWVNPPPSFSDIYKLKGLSHELVGLQVTIIYSFSLDPK
jgi:hypothetical protein